MKKHYARPFLFINQLLLLASLVLLLICLLTSYWIEHDAGQHFGLREYCNRDDCESREDILLFKKQPPTLPWPQEPFQSYDFDVILVSLIIAIIFMSLAIFTSLRLCCSIKRRKWRISGTVVTLLALISVVFSLVGISHFEGKKGDPKLSKAYKHGWSAVVAWAGFAVGVVATILCLVASCVDPDDHSKKPHSVRSTRSSEDTRDTWPCSRDNKAFEYADGNRDAFYIGKNSRGRHDPPVPMQQYEDDYTSPRGSTNIAYHTDYHSDYRPNDLVYDPRTRAKNENRPRRRQSIEMAYSSDNASDHESGKHPGNRGNTYSSGYLTSTDEQNTSMSTTGYDPRRTNFSPYVADARPPPEYKPRSQRSGRRPNIDVDGYQVR